MRDRLIELIRKSGCVDTWNYHTDDFKEPDPINELADYLLANGVIVPPCKVGDTVYIIDEFEDECSERYVLDVKVTQLFINDCGIAVDLQLPLGFRMNAWAVVGNNVFLTREEAERALKGGE